MEALRVLRVLLVLLVLLVSVQRSECVRCFERFDSTSGGCDGELGDVDEDSCCQNPKYGYQATDGVCRSCGPPVWSPWTPWSLCSVLCDDGVTQRTRTCYGTRKHECENKEITMETTRCNNTCCDGRGWASWRPWSPCSVTCGGGGVRRRERVCSVAAECRSACRGDAQETDTCLTTTCPVHGGWSSWSGWSQCSGSCNDDQGRNVPVPTRQRQRTCTNPAPSKDTTPPGNDCPGDEKQVQDCGFLPNCPVDGAWGAWSPPGRCSVSCGEGLQLSTRRCDSPAPKYGGQYCPGQSTKTHHCQSPCPVDGFWSGWSSWSDCSSVCKPQGALPVRTRQRSCTNPAPSASPPGNSCQGPASEKDTCNSLPHCPVDGVWGRWSPFSSCPVSCGAGLQVSVRRCDSPAPNYGGRPCPGDGRQTKICKTGVPCPVDGVWSEWSSWADCKYRNSRKNINCTMLGGSQTRDRYCNYRVNGSICDGDLRERRVCYDVDKCRLQGTWGWDTWSVCRPLCGGSGTSRRARRRLCEPDYSKYRPTIGKQNATFFGKPDCGNPPGGRPYETELCRNVPAC